MAEMDLDLTPEEETPRRLHFEWLWPVLTKPAKTMHHIIQQQNGVWLAPLLLLTALTIIVILIGGPIRQQQAQAVLQNGEPPPGFEYMTPEEQAQFQSGMQVSSGPVFTYVLPAISALGGVWIQWVLLGSLLHLGLTLAGSRGSSTSALNLVGWASIPIAIRLVVQAVYMLSTQRLVASPGLSGFIPADAGGGMLFLSALLANIDLYYLWMLALILIGVLPMTGLPRPKAWIFTLLMALIMLALQSLPAFISGQFSGISTVRPFFF